MPINHIDRLFCLFIAEQMANHAPQRDDEESLAMRWRSAVLRLADELLGAAGQHEDLEDILMTALDHALMQLLLHGDDRDLLTVEHWLDAGQSFAADMPDNGRGQITVAA